jgi:Uma2 family endonuclease
MSTVLDEPREVTEGSSETLADLLHRLGDIPADRVRLHPPPGMATEEDVIRCRLCELIDGALVEKAVGWEESLWGMSLGTRINNHLARHRIAVVAGPDGLTRLKAGRVRQPDVAVYLLNRFPRGKGKRQAICELPPDWAVEVLSASNTRREMEIKRRQYFEAGVRRVWIIDPRQRTIEDWTAPQEKRLLTVDDTADLGDILPGFTLKLADWFAELDALLESDDDQ